ncbi:MAG TPA: ABC transporter permease [Mycobacteriales bacterium]|nr:ABC transporter permease [Mycobacteriales bacterium]
MSTRFLILELRRTLRSPRYLMFAVAFPVGLFLLFAALYGDGALMGTTARAYLMISMATFGAMGTSLSAGTRIAVDRQTGWNRLLRLTPLRPRWYVMTRFVSSLGTALPALLLVFLAGRLLGVRMSGSQWGRVGLYFALALVPFAVLSVALGYLVTADSAPMINGASQMVLSLFGGVWVPVSQMPHLMLTVGKALPSFWLGVAARSPLTGEHLGVDGLAVLVGWTVVLAGFAARRYRRDAARS